MSQPPSPHPSQASPDQLSVAGTARAAIGAAEVLTLIHQEADNEKGYLKFVQEQSEKDRAYFDHLFKRTVWFLGLLLAASAAVIAFFGIHTLSQLREEMRVTTREELRKAQNEVRDRIDAEFKTQNIHELVRQVAKERTERELSSLIKQTVDVQVALGVRAEEPRITRTVSDQTRQAVDRLSPVINSHVAAEVDRAVTQEVNQRMAAFDRSLTALGELADMGMRMRIGLRSGLEDLTSRTRSADSELERKRAKGLLTRITADYEAFPIAEYPGGRPIPLLVQVIRSDKNLNAVAAAFIALRKVTGQQFTMFDFGGVERWCKEKAPACN